MSLITDIDYLVHSLRLTYLRHSEDPYAPRIVSLDPNYPNNPYIRAAGLADADRWPEIDVPISPQPTHQDLPATGVPDVGDPGTVVGKWPGATGLKYTQTIMGNRSGGAGMRVTGRRTSKVSPFVAGPLAESRFERLRADSEPTPVSASPPEPAPLHVESASPVVPNLFSTRRRSSGGSTIVGNDRPRLASDPTAPVVDPEPNAPATPIFAPQFARGAEMEARRRMRMRARFPLTAKQEETGDQPVPAPVPVLLVDDDSDDSEPEEEEYTDEGMNEAEDAREIADDEFDGADFLTPGYGQRSMATSNGSDDISVLSSQMGISMSQASGYNLPLQVNSIRNRVRLSPVAEATKPETMQPSEREHARVRRTPRQNESGGPSNSESFVVLPSKPPVEPSEKPFETTAPLRMTPRPKGLTTKASTPSFRKKIPPPAVQRPGPSALTAKLASQSAASDNPFAELYAAISGREDSHFELTLYFPHSKTYKSTPRRIKVRKDVTVEEVIGHALWIYWEDKAEPRLDDGLDDSADQKIRLSAAGWCLRIVEDDGEVDEDYPVVGRASAISRWWKYGLAVCEATASQTQQNMAMDSTIIRRPSRLMASSRSRSEGSTSHGSATGNVTNGTSSGGLTSSDTVASSALNGVASVANLHSSSGTPVFLKITVAEAADAIHYSTTLNVTTDMYMADVLDLVCRKRRLPSSKDWALLLEDRSILIPLDRTVASLEGRKDLVIMKRSLLDNLGSGQGRQPGRSADPNASIFDKNKHYSDLPTGGVDFTSAYKKYTIYRKVPMVFGSHERILAIDGDYIHFMPSATRALLESAKTSSYHIKTVLNCILTKKDAGSVKLIVRRDGGNKRYDFEAESPALAGEIVATIKNLQKSYSMERSASHHRPKDKSRRPRSSSVIV